MLSSVIEPTSAAEAYSLTGAIWGAGPSRVYDRMAEVVVERCPVDLSGGVVLDLGAGTGAASRVIGAAGGIPVAADPAVGMLEAGRTTGAPPVAADAVALPFAAGVMRAVVAAFSLNHVPDAAAALREAARVTASGGAVVASAYAADDDHPAKTAVDQAAAELGWRPAPWYAAVRHESAPRLATVEAAAAVVRDAGVGHDPSVEHLVVAVDGLTPDELLAWRMGLAQTAPFLAGLDPGRRRTFEARARELLGDDPPPLRRSIIVLSLVI